jgi:two-component system NarL family sensor kinase
MGARAVRKLDFLISDPLPVRSLLRLALIALIALLVSVSDVAHWFGPLFVAVLVAYAVAAIAWAAFLTRRPFYEWYRWAATAVDVLFVVALCVVSGGATVLLLPIFFLLPIPVVFLESPLVTAALGAGAGLGYLVAWFVHAVRDEGTAIPAVVYVQVGCLLWLAAALSVLSLSLRRRARRVESLLEVRRRLVSEMMQADARNSRSLSEQLHDGPLQNLLAARVYLHRLRATASEPDIEQVDAALLEAVSALRGAVSTLHPEVLDRAGLTMAIRQLVDGHELRWGIPIQADLEEVGCPVGQEMLYRAARELLVNAAKHARAERIRVRLRREAGADTVTLLVADDGIGFDPDLLADRVAEGHIGLASLVAGIEALGGSVLLDTAPGAGTAVTVALPGSTAPSRPAVQSAALR